MAVIGDSCKAGRGAGSAGTGAMDKTIGYWLQHAARLHRARTAAAVADLGLFPGQEQAMLLLAGGEVRTVGDLAEALKVRPPTVSKTLQRLAAQGMIERKEHAGDARKTLITLTKDGARCARGLASRMAAVEQALAAELDGKDERRLRKLLRRVTRTMSGEPGAAPEAEGEDAE